VKINDLRSEKLMKLKKSVNPKNNKAFYYIEGNSYPIRQQLGRQGLGFLWDRFKKKWWSYTDYVGPEKVAALGRLGVDTSEAGGQAPVAEPSPTGTVEPVQEERTPELTNKSDSDSGKYLKDVYPEAGYSYDKVPGRYGFNIKSNIYSTDVEVDLEGQKIPLRIQMDRWYQKGRRRIPKYIYTAYFNDKIIWNIAHKPPGEWGSYNEDELAAQIPEKIQEFIGQKGKLYKSIVNQLDLGKRDPEFAKFLEDWDKLFKKDEQKQFLSRYLTPKTIKLDEPGYEGEYNISMEMLGGTPYLSTDVEHPLAPYAKNLGGVDIPSTVSNLEQFNLLIDNYISANQEKIKEVYLKYLKSFPFRKEEEETSRADMEKVVNMIGNTFDINLFKNKLAELGYIRPSKKVKKEERTPGFIPQEKIKWVLESKKIVNDAYSYGQNPDSFYSTIAYWLHRKVKNISSWSDMMLNDAINHWHKLSKQYGHELDYKVIYEYFDKVSSDLYRELFYKEPPTSTYDNWQNFYSGQRGREQGVSTSPQGSLPEFVNFVVSLGATAEEANNDPKGVYRRLSLKYHPDVNPNLPEEEKKIFNQLAILYNNLPLEVRRASNWYMRIFK